MLKIMTILGTRPEIIRLSKIIPLLDKYSNHTLVNTNQNYDENLNKIFFKDLKLREADINLGISSSSFGQQVGELLKKTNDLFIQYRPDRIIILGDTNSGLCSIVANRLGIPVYHLEAGNRCFDDRVPEEVNRRVIDHSSTILLPYTERSKENLLTEGIANNKIHVTGNPIAEVIQTNKQKIQSSSVLKKLNLKKGNYFLVTLHRAENVDIKSRLKNIITGIDKLSKKWNVSVIISTHPRTRERLKEFKVSQDSKRLRYFSPFNFFDFICLEKEAGCILTDSGTVQEEACILKIPSLILRDVTERPEIIDSGASILTGDNPNDIVSKGNMILDRNNRWDIPAEYKRKSVSKTVTNIVLGYKIPSLSEKAWQDFKD
ncbi:MAG: non-hydrolyzing UDP-N-acetylglucosamine 2-epimerase [Promethearchaeota archaeon]|jgi:UDP-N-acetylglucosamine 2-epimerase (non-hydrolysing)